MKVVEGRVKHCRFIYFGVFVGRKMRFGDSNFLILYGDAVNG
jgi:hypothetical protein